MRKRGRKRRRKRKRRMLSMSVGLNAKKIKKPTFNWLSVKDNQVIIGEH